MHESIYSPHYDFYIDLCQRGPNYEMSSFHFHKKYELYYLISGSRRYFVDDNTYLVNAGDIVLINSDEIHKTGPVGDEGHTRAVMNFTEELLTPFSGNERVDLFSCFKRGIHVVSLPMRMRPMIESLFRRIYEERDSNTPSSLVMRCCLVCELLLYIDRFMSEQDSALKDNEYIHNKTIADVKCHISAHYNEELSLSDIATKFYLSPSYLSRLFKRVTGLSIVEYINSVRIMSAKNLLEKTDNRISDIAQQAGFSTTIHFTRVFKASTSLSPQQYRKYHKQNR